MEEVESEEEEEEEHEDVFSQQLNPLQHSWDKISTSAVFKLVDTTITWCYHGIPYSEVEVLLGNNQLLYVYCVRRRGNGEETFVVTHNKDLDDWMYLRNCPKETCYCFISADGSIFLPEEQLMFSLETGKCTRIIGDADFLAQLVQLPVVVPDEPAPEQFGSHWY